MRVAVVGSGEVGRTLGAGLARGHAVTLGTRDPAAAAEWADGAGVAVAPPADAVAGAELVVNATPGSASVAALTAAGLGDRDDVVLLDVSNPLDFSTGTPRLSTEPGDSVGEQLQRAFPRARVVKSLCTVTNPVMVDPTLLPEPTAMFVAGDDAAAKQVVSGVLTGLGWDPDQLLDLGGIEAARPMEANILLWLAVFRATGTAVFNVRVVRARSTD